MSRGLGDVYKRQGKDTVTEEEKKAVYEIIIKERYWLKYPSIPFEIEKDYYYLLH